MLITLEEMKNYLEVALNLADECNYHKEMGILLRLKGLNMIMQGNFPEAERLLRESISTFMVTQNVQRRYALNIAGAYNYLGEIRRGEGKFQEALDYYDKALEYAKIRKPTAPGWSFPAMRGSPATIWVSSPGPGSIFSRPMSCSPVCVLLAPSHCGILSGPAVHAGRKGEGGRPFPG